MEMNLSVRGANTDTNPTPTPVKHKNDKNDIMIRSDHTAGTTDADIQPPCPPY